MLVVIKVIFDIVIILTVGIGIVFAVRSLICEIKSGNCGNDCSGCNMREFCHKKKEDSQ